MLYDYSILPILEGVSILRRLDKVKLHGEVCAFIPNASNVGSDISNDNDEHTHDNSVNTRSFSDPNTFCNCVVKTLVFYRPGVLVQQGYNLSDLEQEVELAVTQTNQALENSGIDLGDLRLELHPEIIEWSGLPFDATDISKGVDDFRTDPFVIGLRDNPDINADIVVLITPDIYNGFGGVADVLGASNLSNAAAIVERASMTSTFTFAHEIGHLLDGSHQKCSLTNISSCDPSTTGFNNGYKYERGVLSGGTNGNLPVFNEFKESTLMHSLNNVTQRVLQFSNPDVEASSFLVTKTGVENDADNIRAFENHGCILAGLNPTIQPPFSVNIVASDDGDDFEYTFTLEGAVEGGMSPFTFLWEKSTNVFDYQTIGSTPTIDVSVNAYELTTFRLTVTDANGETRSNSFTIFYVGNGLFNPYIGNTDITANNSYSEAVSLKIAPNPAISETNIYFNIEETTDAIVSLRDMNGNELRRISESNLAKGRYIHNCQLEGLPRGIYLISLQTNKGIVTKNIIVN